jgi:hypothetical protein
MNQMSNHQSTTDDDAYDIINGKKVLKDGARVHVTLMDAERARRRARLTDAAGRSDPLAFSKPGYRLTAGEPGSVDHDEPPDRHRFDEMTLDQIQRSHQENMRRIYDEVACKQSEAWKQR